MYSEIKKTVEVKGATYEYKPVEHLKIKRKIYTILPFTDVSNSLLNGNVAQKACTFYTNLTTRHDKEFDLRIAGGELAAIGEFPWMVSFGVAEFLSIKWYL